MSKNTDKVVLSLNGTPIVGKPHDFDTGSKGWHASGKAVILVDGVPTEVQVGANIVIIGSNGKKAKKQ